MPETRRDRERRTGRRRRTVVPRTSQAVWEPAAGRPDPIALLDAENAGRVPALVPVRWGRMLESPFAFIRGAAGLMAADLARTPSTGLHVQLCGDAHMANFGVFASPERRLLFDVNDFDETTPGPWEWDLKRLAASAVVVGRVSGIEPEHSRPRRAPAARAYRRHMGRYAQMGTLEVWYERVDAKARPAHHRPPGPAVRSTVAGAHRQTSQAELPQLTVRVHGGARALPTTRPWYPRRCRASTPRLSKACWRNTRRRSRPTAGPCSSGSRSSTWRRRWWAWAAWGRAASWPCWRATSGTRSSCR